MRRDTDKARAFAQRGRESSARSLERSRRRKPRERKPASPIDQWATPCWLAQFDPDTPCEGIKQRAHLLKEQFLRDQLGLSMERRWESCWWMPGCLAHHRRFDNLDFRIPRAALPAAFERALDRHPRAAARATSIYGPRPKLIERAAA